MKITLMAGIAALAFTGIARADDIVSVTLTGYITGGYDSGPTGTGDDANLFGGGDLYNAAVLLTFSYDVTAIVASGRGLYSYNPSGVSSIAEENPPDAFETSITINGVQQSIAPTNPGAGSASMGNAGSSFGEDYFFTSVQDSSGDEFYLESSQGGSSPDFDVAQQADVSNYFSRPGTENYIFIRFDGTFPDELFANFTPASSTPEPETWLSLAVGLGALALKIRRRSVRQRISHSTRRS